MAVVFLVVVFILSAGFAKVMAMFVNWICAQRVAKKFIIADKGLNLALIVAYPILLFFCLGLFGPHLLTGGSIGQMGFAEWVLVLVGATGILLLANSTIRYWRYRPPECELSVVGRIEDLRRETSGEPWQKRFVGPRGHMRRIALLPGNEQFTIEISTKTYELPRLPAAWDGLSIVHLSDFHFYRGVARAYFEAVCDHAVALNPDMYIFSGDLLDDLRRLDWVPDTLGRLKAPLGQFYILGNHDWYLDPPATRRELNRLGWTDLAEGFVAVTASHPQAQIDSLDPSTRLREGQVPLVLCGDETPWMGTHANLTDAPADAFRILVSHTPDNIGWARKNSIDLMLSGHTHGGQIRLPVLGPVYSPSNFGCRYASGVFWLDPTLMYVSRGVSGKEPIRYNCPPEVTKLVLKSAAVSRQIV